MYLIDKAISNLVGVYNPIQLIDYEDEWDKIIAVLDTYFSDAYAQHALEKNQGISTYNHPSNQGFMLHKLPEFEKLVTIIEAYAECHWVAYGLSERYRPVVKMMWANIHNKGDYTAVHQHSNSILVGAFYLKFPKDAGDIFFENPLEYHTCHEPRDMLSLYTHEIEEHDLCIFPGWLKHGTHKSNSDESRIVIAINFDVIKMV
jgi:uncharacterized protein (TIGR02466 family)